MRQVRYSILGRSVPSDGLILSHGNCIEQEHRYLRPESDANWGFEPVVVCLSLSLPDLGGALA